MQIRKKKKMKKDRGIAKVCKEVDAVLARAILDDSSRLAQFQKLKFTFAFHSYVYPYHPQFLFALDSSNIFLLLYCDCINILQINDPNIS